MRPGYDPARRGAELPQKDTSVDHCLGVSAKKNGVALAVDSAGLALTVFAPETKLFKAAEWTAASVGIVNAGVGGEPTDIVKGVFDYHLMMADWGSFKGAAGKLVKFAGEASGVIGLINDGSNAVKDFVECRAGGTGK
jgi:hypothetical protein